MPAQQYRKKPVVIEAIQYRAPTTPGDGNVQDLLDWGAPIEPTGQWSETYELIVRTLEDGSDAQVEHIASPGDWIVKGIKGEYYPVKPDIFDATYEPNIA